jgi:hypothetical protein
MAGIAESERVMGFLDDLLGRKPVVPEVPALSLPEEQRKAVDANLAIAPEAAKLATFSQEQINKMMEMAIPGFAGMRGQIAGNIGALLRGEIPTDVSQEVKRQGAGRALTGGFAGTDAASKLVARDLGLTSLGLTKEGLSSAESWIQNMEQLFSPSQALFSGMMVTPQQMFSAATQERDVQFQKKWLQEQIDSLPSPAAAAFKEAVQSALSIYSGASVTPSKYSTGGWGNPDFSGGVPNSYDRDSGINWGASDWRANDNTTNTPWDWSGTTPRPQSGDASNYANTGIMGAF